jgi:hypothetical protein
MRGGAANYARVTIAGVCIFTAIMYVAFVFIQPELDPFARFGSEYVAGRMGWLMRVAFFCLSGGLLSFAAAMTVGLDATTRSSAAAILFALGALGILLSGIFDTDLQIPALDSPRRWVDPPVASQHHVVHLVAGVSAFLAIVLGMVITTGRLRRAGRLYGQFRWLILLAWLAPFALVVFNVWLIPVGFAGLGQRMFLAVVFAWLLLAARGFMKGDFVLEERGR